MDLYISGVGWVSLRGVGKATLTVRAPPGTLKVRPQPPATQTRTECTELVGS